MSRISETIPDDTVLAAKLSLVLNSDLPNFLKTTYSERAHIRSGWLFVAVAVAFLMAIIIAFIVFAVDFSTISGKLFAGVAMGWAAVLLISGRSLFTSKKLLSREMNMAMSPIITNTLEALVLYTHTEETPEDVSGTLRSLLHKSDITVKSKDRYQVFGEPTVQFDEVYVSRDASKLVTEFGGAELATGVLVTAAVSPEFNDVYAVSAPDDMLLDAVWEQVSVGKYVVPIESSDIVRIASEREEQETAIKRTVEPALAFLGMHHKDGFVCVIENGTMQLLLLGDSIQIPLGSSTTDRTIIARQGYRILTPMWKGIRVVEELAPVV